MADATLTNIASATGTYDGVSMGMDSEAVATRLVDGLRIEQSADKEIWVTGNLIYTITVTNSAASAYENPVITDTLDPSLVTLVEGSVMIDAATTADYTFDTCTGRLSVRVPTIAAGTTSVVTFQVRKA